MYSFPNFELVHCSMSGSNCCFLTCIQISQEAGQVVWYSHLLKNFPQFVVIHTVKGFGIVNKTETDVFLEVFCFFNDPADVGNLISGSSAYSKCISLEWPETSGRLWEWWKDPGVPDAFPVESLPSWPGVLQSMGSQRLRHD